MCCCGSPKSPKSKGLKHFHFVVKPSDLAKTHKANPWIVAVEKLGWKVVDSVHVPGGHYYNSNEIWDDHLLLVSKGKEYAVLQCVRRPMQGKNTMIGEKTVALKAPRGKKNPAKEEFRRKHIADKPYDAKLFTKWYKMPHTLPVTDAQRLAEIRKNLKGFKGTDKATAVEKMNTIAERWLKGTKRKNFTAPVKIGVWDKDVDHAKGVLTRKGWTVKVAK